MEAGIYFSRDIVACQEIQVLRTLLEIHGHDVNITESSDKDIWYVTKEDGSEHIELVFKTDDYSWKSHFLQEKAVTFRVLQMLKKLDREIYVQERKKHLEQLETLAFMMYRQFPALSKKVAPFKKVMRSGEDDISLSSYVQALKYIDTKGDGKKVFKRFISYLLQKSYHDEDYEKSIALLHQYPKVVKRWRRDLQAVWSTIEVSEKRRLCERFELTFSEEVSKLIEQVEGHLFLPRAFCIAAVNKTDAKPHAFIEQNPYVDLWWDRLDYFRDGWGILYDDAEYFGLFEGLEMTSCTPRQLEKSFRCSLSLDPRYPEDSDTRSAVIDAIPTLSTFQLDALYHQFRDEAKSFFIKSFSLQREKISTMVVQTKRRWQKRMAKRHIPTPVDISKHVSRYIIGQDTAVKSVAKTLYYHHVSSLFGKDDKDAFVSKPIMLAGPTGSGKTMLVKTAAEYLSLPFVHVDCSTLVSVGIKGYSVNDVLKEIIRRCDYDYTEISRTVVFLDEADKLLQHHDSSVKDQLFRMVEGGTMTIEKSNPYEERTFKDIDSISLEGVQFIFGGSFEYQKEEKNTPKVGLIQEVRAHQDTWEIEDVEKAGLPKELIGRITEIVMLRALDAEDYVSILSNSEISPLKRYEKMLAYNGVKSAITQEELKQIALKATKLSYGARSLSKLLEEHFDALLFDAPDSAKTLWGQEYSDEK